MKTNTYFKIIFMLSLGGVLFAGYLSIVQIVTGTCALNEPCPYFLGYPACWYGLVMFLSIFVFNLVALLSRISFRTSLIFITIISFAGILFSGWLSWGEILSWLNNAITYAMILPTCVYGLIFYLAIFILSVIQITKKQV